MFQVVGGERVPADLRVLEATELKVNNAPLTGENLDIRLKTEPGHKVQTTIPVTRSPPLGCRGSSAISTLLNA